MNITDPSILVYLHDAMVFEVKYDVRDTNNTSMILSVKCDSESGYPDWDGKRLTIRLKVVVMMAFSAFEPATRMEQIDSWRPSVSAKMESEILRHQTAGYNSSGERFSITFQSGSVLEGLCRQIVVEEASPPT